MPTVRSVVAGLAAGMCFWGGLAVCAAMAVQPQAPPLAEARRGEGIYQARCTGCHSLADNKAGPMHRGVFGRKAGAVKGYDYSPALARSGLTWDEATLDKWLENPEKLVPGQKMFFSVDDPQDRADLIAYLKSVSL